MARPAVHAPRAVGRYVLYEELASGGMATVHFGRLSGPVGFSRTVAIKRLHPQYAKDPEFVTMFLDEARLCGRIRHPNVVPTLDVVATDGEIFLVMEYVAGEAFSKLLKAAQQKNVLIPARVAATIISSVLHGLHAAHVTKDEHGRELGIVHRDVSPQNILIGTDGTARVLDFGVAKAAGRVQTTREGQLKGKIAYMPPEQLTGAAVTKQADIYGASVVLWEALTGRRLFDGETETIVLARALEGTVEPPSVHNPALDRAIDALVLRGLARDAALRFSTAREMALALEQQIGLASPSEVGAWVEMVSGEELARRAQTVASIEMDSLAPRPVTKPSSSEMHSQVSSISVSRAAVSGSLPRRGASPRFAIAAMALLALAGGGVGILATRESGALARHDQARPWEHEGPRALEVVRPEAVTRRATREAPALAVRPAPTGRRSSGSSGGAPDAAKGNPCDQVFTIDPVTGRKKYKLECLK